jgi:hypothetical protein
MWAPYEPPEIGESLDELEKLGEFVLVEVRVRENVHTAYGPRDAADLRVQTTQRNLTRLFSGFSAGVVGQSKRVQPGDLPAVCRIVPTEVGRGRTRGLALVRTLEAGAELAKIAVSLATPVLPTPGQADDIPW